MNTLDKRQIIILAAFCLPLFVLIFVSYSGTGHNPAPKKIEQRPVMAANKTARNGGQIIPRTAEIQRVKGLLKIAEAMTEGQYQEMKKAEPTFVAPDIDVRRGRLKRRIAQLEGMTDAQWESEQRAGIKLAPDPENKNAGAATAPAQADKPAEGKAEVRAETPTEGQTPFPPRKPSTAR